MPLHKWQARRPRSKQFRLRFLKVPKRLRQPDAGNVPIGSRLYWDAPTNSTQNPSVIVAYGSKTLLGFYLDDGDYVLATHDTE